MRLTFIAAIVFCFSVALPGCKSSKQKITEYANLYLAHYEALLAVLQSVNDQQSADAAVPRIKAMKARFEELKKAGKATVSKMALEYLKAEYEGKIADARGGVERELLRVLQGPGGKEVFEAAMSVMLSDANAGGS